MQPKDIHHDAARGDRYSQRERTFAANGSRHSEARFGNATYVDVRLSYYKRAYSTLVLSKPKSIPALDEANFTLNIDAFIIVASSSVPWTLASIEQC